MGQRSGRDPAKVRGHQCACGTRHVVRHSAVAHPKFSAALVGTLIKGMGADHIMWGTDSVWYGSPQWQIEAMRRLEIPEDMQKKYGFPALGDANSATKQLIFGANAA